MFHSQSLTTTPHFNPTDDSDDAVLQNLSPELLTDDEDCPETRVAPQPLVDEVEGEECTSFVGVDPDDVDFPDGLEYRDNRRVRRAKAAMKRYVLLLNLAYQFGWPRDHLYTALNAHTRRMSLLMDLASARFARRHHQREFCGVPASFTVDQLKSKPAA